MTFRQRILLDRLLAVPLAVSLNALVVLLGRLLRRDHSIQPATTREIVVCKLVGMGSILQATPLLRALKQHFPQARLTFVTLRANTELVKRVEGVDQTLYLDDRGVLSMIWTTARVLASLISRRTDHYFDLEVYSGFTCLLSLFSLARNRLGFYRHSNRFKKGIYTHLVYFNTRMPVRRIYLQLGCLAGVSTSADGALGQVDIQPSERGALRQKLSALGLDVKQRFILVNPNASDLLIERRWPREYFVEAISRLAERGHSIVLMGTQPEAAYVKSLLEGIPAELQKRVFNTAGGLALGELLALIDAAACLLTNDTGPMHMAFALQRPVVCLVGPADPVHYGMEGPHIVTLYAPVSCSPCIYEVDEPPCHGNNVCMKRLSPQLVVENVLALLAQGTHDLPGPPAGARPNTSPLPLVWADELGHLLGTFRR
jgi:ADP-heptose:LPS heptosyltransferase